MYDEAYFPWDSIDFEEGSREYSCNAQKAAAITSESAEILAICRSRE